MRPLHGHPALQRVTRPSLAGPEHHLSAMLKPFVCNHLRVQHLPADDPIPEAETMSIRRDLLLRTALLRLPEPPAWPAAPLSAASLPAANAPTAALVQATAASRRPPSRRRRGRPAAQA